MVNIIVQLSKYLMILMITVYTYLCFSIFGYYDPDKKKRCLRKQNVLMFVMHLTAFLVMYLEKKDTKILALYLMQVTLLGGTILLYSFIYPKVSRLVVNNMCMLLSIGFIMITRLNYDKAAKQYLIAAAGIVLCLVIPIIIRKVRFLSEWRILYGIVGIVSLAVVVVVGRVSYGAMLGFTVAGINIQPSELVKLAFILAGAATLDRLFAKRNLIFTVLFSAYCVGCLALMSDFGTALVFFVAFLCIAFLRTGDLASIVMMTAAAGFAGGLVLHFKPYVAQRFTVWRHAWEFTQTTGYQQSRTMSAAASGGLLGTGPEDAWLKYVGAANTDLVFGVVSEEFGLLLALVCVTAVIALAAFALRAGDSARSSFYAIAACGAASMLVFQTSLNVLGAVDILPLTGVTFPFVSMGGSSMLSCWGLLAYLKAVDVRRPPEKEISPPPKSEKTPERQEGFFDGIPGVPVDEIFGKEERS